MKSKLISRALVTLFLLFSLGTLSAADYYESPMGGISPRLTGMGGVHTGFADGFHTLYTNPAGFYRSGEEISWSELSLGLKGPVFSIADAIVGRNTDLASIGDLLTGIYTGFTLTGPLSFGYVGKGLGLAVVMNSDLLLYSYTPLAATALVQEDILLLGGYSFPINILPDTHSLEGGLLLKGGFRGELTAGVTAVEIQNFDLASLMDDEPFSFISLIGMDLGLLYCWKDALFVGLTVKDLYTPTSRKNYTSLNSFLAGDAPDPADPQDYGIVPVTINLGSRYRLDLQEKNIFIRDVDFYLDYEDLFDFWFYPKLAVHPLLHLSLGAELTMLEILDVRFGFSQGLPAAGLGLDLHWFTMNASMFGTERSTEPGMSPVYNLQLAFEFRY